MAVQLADASGHVRRELPLVDQVRQVITERVGALPLHPLAEPLNQPVEPLPDGRVGDPVLAGEVLDRAGDQHEGCDHRQVLFSELHQGVIRRGGHSGPPGRGFHNFKVAFRFVKRVL